MGGGARMGLGLAGTLCQELYLIPGDFPRVQDLEGENKRSWSSVIRTERRWERTRNSPGNADPCPGALQDVYTHLAPGPELAHLFQLPEELHRAGALEQGPIEEGNSATVDSQWVVRETILWGDRIGTESGTGLSRNKLKTVVRS